MLKTASKPVDVQDLHFKLQCRLNIFDKQEANLSKTSQSLLASASRYGLVFVGCTSAKLKVISFESIESNTSTEATKSYPRREINLISEPYHISVNCDHTILAVVVQKDNCLCALFYDVLSFYKENVVVLNEIRLTSTPGLEVLQANWHPTLNNIFTECKSDGTLGIYELKDKSFDVKKLPAESRACCFCWSPKGKQIAVGSQDGKIIHYKPDLKAVKSIDAPPFNKPYSVLSLQWISNYQFVGVFKMSNESDPECSVVLIDAPKTGNPMFTNFYDICYSNGNYRPPQFYMIAEQHWNLLLVASANSMEVGVLSNTGEIWAQWILPDSARAELPLDENQDETFPIGMAIDTSSDKPVLWGESYLQPAPSLILLSHEGVLCCFRIVNLKEGAPSVNSPAEKVADLSGLRHFVVPVSQAATPQVQESAVLEKNVNPTSTSAATPAFSNQTSIFTLPSSTPTVAPSVQPQSQQTPTTPLSIFKSPEPRQQFPSVPTNLFGGQISITPVKSKETAPPSSVASTGSSLLSNILSQGAATQRVAPMGSTPFSNVLPSQTSITPLDKQTGTTPVLSTSGSGQMQTSNLFGGGFKAGSGQAQNSNMQGTGFTISSISGSGQVQTGNAPSTGFTISSNPGSGQVQTGNVPSSGFTLSSISGSGQVQTGNVPSPGFTLSSNSGSGQVQTGNVPSPGFTLSSNSGSGQVQTGHVQGTGLTVSSSPGSGQVQTGNLHGTSFTASSISGSGQVQTGNLQGSGFTMSSSPGSGQVQTGSLHGTSSSVPSSGGGQVQTGSLQGSGFTMSSSPGSGQVQTGLQKSETKPSVLSPAPNTQNPRTPVKTDQNLEEESEEIKNMLTRMIQMECVALNNEIRDLVFQGQHLKIPLRSEEMGHIMLSAENINEFLKELVETCEIQNSEIHILKQNTIQSWAWVEETRSRYKESRDEQLTKLIKAKPLDSVSEKHLCTLKQMKYYLDSQLKQSHKSLDDQWDKFQDYCRKNTRMQLPTMEAIFQTMVKQNAVLQRHNYILKDINSQIRGKQKASNNAALFNPADKKDNLELSFQNLKLEPENIYNIYYQKVLNRVKSVPPSKTNQLRRILHNRDIPHVLVKSTFSNSALNSSLRTNQQLLNMTVKTPIANKANSQLYQTTPLNLTPELAPQVASTPLSAFAPNNLVSKAQVPTRFGSESNSSFNKETPSLSGDKQSVTPQSQNSLFKTSTIGTNDKVGFNAFSNFGCKQNIGQNMFGTNKISATSSFSSTPVNLQTQKSVPQISPAQASKPFSQINSTISSSGSNMVTSTVSQNAFGLSTSTPQTSAPNKIFSFASSAAQFPNSTGVTSPTSIGGFSTPSTGSTAPTTGGTMSFFGSNSNTISGFGKPGTAGLFASSSNFSANSPSNKENAVTSTQTSSNASSAQATSGFMFGTPSPNDAALPSGGVSENVPPEANNEAVPTTGPSFFGTSNSKPSVTFNLSGNSGQKAAVSIFSVPAASESIPSSSSTSTTTGRTNSASSTSQFGSSILSSGSVQTTIPSIFSLSSKREEPTTGTVEVTSSSQSILDTAVTSTVEVSSSSSSIFGTATPSTVEVSSSGPSVFGSAATSTVEVSSSGPSVFGTAAPSTVEVSSSSQSPFGTPATSVEVSSSSQSVFGTAATGTVEVSSSSPSIFGTGATSTVEVSSSSTSVFGTAVKSTGEVSSSPTSIFGNAGASTNSRSIFGASVTSSGIGLTDTPSVFGNSAPATSAAAVEAATSKSIFNTVPSNTTFSNSASSSVPVASSASVPTSSKSLFGSTVSSSASVTKTPDTKTESSTKSIFNTAASNTAAVPSSAPSIFGASSGGVQANKSIFGTSAAAGGAASTTSSSIFGASAASSGALPLNSISIFANAAAEAATTTNTTTPAANSQPSPFGTSAFGAATAAPTGSIFGNAASASSPFGSTAGKSVFGSTAPASSPFGASAPVSSSPFAPTPFASATSSNSVFGQATSTASPFSTPSVATSPFGGTAASAQTPFGATPSTADSPFGAATPPVCSPFGAQGFGTAQPSPFGQVSSTSSNVFGSSNSTSGSAFGAASTTENASSPFGQSTGGMFGSFGSAAAKPAEGSFGFGSLNVGSAANQSPFGKPNENKSPFGSGNFNPTSSSGSLFGSSSFGNNNGNSVFRQSAFGGASAFSSPQQPQSGPFSGGAGSIAQTGFGVQSPQKPSAFGAAPSFGGTPAFGSAPTFGGAPAFGSTSSFGSPNKVFGSPNPTPAGSAFGSTNTQQSSGFGSFGSQGSLGFGGMAQQPTPPGTNPTQGTGFGNFASQNTIGFGNLAQQTNNPGQNAPFSGASSFSSWR